MTLDESPTATASQSDVQSPKPGVVVIDETSADDVTRPGSSRGQSEPEAERLFSKSIVISGIRCVLTYLILPFVAPLIGLAPGVGAGFGLAIGVVAIAANIFSIRRFWSADHRWKVPVTVLHVCVIGLLVGLAATDIAELVG